MKARVAAVVRAPGSARCGAHGGRQQHPADAVGATLGLASREYVTRG
jgi:hypothetical protein